MNHFYSAKSEVNGLGLYSRKDYKKFDTVGYIHGDVRVIKRWSAQISERTQNWIGVGRYSWINTDKSPFRYINHSCDPNVAIVTKRKVIALRDIPAGSELLMDYSFTEAEPDWQLAPCRCASARCRKVITTISHIPAATFKKYRQFIPKNFQKIYLIDQQK